MGDRVVKLTPSLAAAANLLALTAKVLQPCVTKHTKFILGVLHLAINITV